MNAYELPKKENRSEDVSVTTASDEKVTTNQLLEKENISTTVDDNTYDKLRN